MTTKKARLTIYLSNPAQLEDLRAELRRLAPIEARGRISGSTAIEAAIGLALRDVTARGRESDVYRAMVTSPAQWEDEFIEIDMTAEAQP